MGTPLRWAAFNFFILLAVCADLRFIHHKPHRSTVREAALSSVAWIAVSILFVIGVRLIRQMPCLFPPLHGNPQIVVVHQRGLDEAAQGLVLEHFPPWQIGQRSRFRGGLSTAHRRCSHHRTLVLWSNQAPTEKAD